MESAYTAKNPSVVTTQRYVRTMDLRDDPKLIEEYKKRHSEEFHWKEIRDGIRAVGILEMEIYILGTRLVMIIDTPPGFDLDTALSRLATLPRQQEWETYMSVFQECRADAASADKWQPMERMFHLYE